MGAFIPGVMPDSASRHKLDRIEGTLKESGCLAVGTSGRSVIVELVVAREQEGHELILVELDLLRARCARN